MLYTRSKHAAANHNSTAARQQSTVTSASNSNNNNNNNNNNNKNNVSPCSPAKPHHPAVPVPRLSSCDLLISVLDCYMTLHIRANSATATPQLCNQPSSSSSSSPSPNPASEPSVFHALQAPSITPSEYLRRLSRYAFCSRSVFIVAFYYLHKIAQKRSLNLCVNALSVHRLLLTATLLATKMMDDVLYDNAHFAKVGGLDVAELNMLELDMLHMLQFELVVSTDQFERFEKRVLTHVLHCHDSSYFVLHERLRNMGYAVSAEPQQKVHQQRVHSLPPCSPVSSIDDLIP
ncbi:Cyclin-U4-1 [Gracilariopsis chorda]|uniref:Cyclin-U4-1 n=1 Tax=Gracilariopsis chorda TaxID=448386 RepID=A0A2V3J5G9_9FLOR|nr:Cyclin-U4-1 [Gracilariopsis chorda]|eukprot:PXF49671.1 Cyclin-U4-1 [Gracilariopsis chorda]